MAKWADYLISTVKYVETKTTKHISQVKIYVDKGESMGNSTIWSREEVIAAIDLKKTFMTIIKNQKGEWTKGALVEKVWEHTDWYIKTKRDNTTKDNLGSLPEF